MAAMDPSELRSRVEDLNSMCGFQNPLNYDKLSEVAAHVQAAKTEQVLKEVEDKKDTVKDPTAWVTSALRKASAGSAGLQSRAGGGAGQGDMDPSELRTRIEDLNSSCGFENPLNYEKLAEVAAHVPAAKTEQVLKEVEEKKDTVKDPTAWVTSALRKASAGSAGKGAGKAGGGGGGQEDEKLRKRIGWLNGDGGGFGGAIIYDKVTAASGGLAYSDVMRVLKELEEKKNDVKDPNAWVCSALRKAGGGNPQASAAFAWAPAPTGGPWGAPMGAGPWGAAAGGGFDAGADSKVRKRVQWLNTTGGFGGAIDAQKVSEAAAGIPSLQDVMKVLKDVEEKKDNVKDPNAYVCAALRKQGGGARGGGGGNWGAPPVYAMGGGDWGGPPMQSAWPGPPAASAWAPDIQGEDSRLRKRIGWLNGQGGFGGAIIYDKIMEAAGGLEFSEVFRQLQQLEEKRDTIKDATAWVCKGLRRVAANGGAQGPPMNYGGPPMQYGGEWAPQHSQWSGGGNMHSGPSPMDVDASTSKLRKRVQWLNENEGFDNPLDFQKVSEAAAGLDSAMQMKVLKDLQEKKDTVKNPTSYVTAAYRKVGGGSKGGGKGAPMGQYGVRQTISKNRH